MPTYFSVIWAGCVQIPAAFSRGEATVSHRFVQEAHFTDAFCNDRTDQHETRESPLGGNRPYMGGTVTIVATVYNRSTTIQFGGHLMA